MEKQDPRQRAGSRGWGGVLKSSGDGVVRKKEKVSRPRSFLVLFLFFPSGRWWQLIRHNSWQSPAGVRIQMTLNSTSRRTGKESRGVSGRG